MLFSCKCSMKNECLRFKHPDNGSHCVGLAGEKYLSEPEKFKLRLRADLTFLEDISSTLSPKDY